MVLAVALPIVFAACGDSGGPVSESNQINLAVALLDPDLNADGVVSAIDLAIVGGCAGKNLSVVPNCRCADTDGDNDVDLTDVRFVKANLRRRGYPTGPNPCINDPRNVDDDGDGFTENQGDCNDANAAVRPGALERCNDLDDDCDQAIDEGFQLGAACSAGIGACLQTGVTVCATDGSAVVCNAISGSATTETCNGADDDCDGVVDDGFNLGALCAAGIGGCQREGQMICAAGGGGTVCDAMAGQAEPERCNGRDDNCDNSVDEGFDVGSACSAGVGACAVAGIKMCSSDGATTICDATPATPQAEICENGIDEDCDGNDGICIVDIAITSPTNLSVFGTNVIPVEGTVGSPLSEVQCYGFSMFALGGTFSGNVPLREGNNTVTCVVRDMTNHIGTASVTVTLDTEAPRLTIESPAADSRVFATPVAVTGMINDITVGTVSDDDCHVTCNGIDAAVSNRSFFIPALDLVPGLNTISCTSADRAGNTGADSVDVTLDTTAQAKIELVSGSNQTGVIGDPLPASLVARVVDIAGNPVAAQKVIFQVTENDGSLSAGGQSGRGVVVDADANGLAQADFTLGTRVGAGNNKVEATAVGFAGAALFTHSALPDAPALIVVDGGNNQFGMVGQELPKPFVAVVIDQGNNRLQGIPVTFRVLQGGGNFSGAPDVTIDTDSDGRAQAVLTLGTTAGIANTVVEAIFFGNSGTPATFIATAQLPGDPADTQVSGVVLDNQNDPLAGVTLRVEEAGIQTQSDAQGRFVIKPVPVGLVTLTADGATVQRPGTWPRIQYELVTVAGQDNTLGMPIFLVPLDLPNGLAVDDTNGGTLTLAQVPGFSLTVAPGSATFPGGSKSGTVSVTLVHNDKIPMPPGFGQQPRFIATIQPSGTIFDPPAPICIPNLDALAPGQKAEMYSFDHDMGQFVSIGPGTISNDGLSLCSDPGVGILKGGWHCGGNPQPTGDCCECPDCKTCQSSSCVNDSGQDGRMVGDQCCFQGDLISKTQGSIEDLESKCPGRQQNMRQHDIDGCSLPGLLGIITPGLSVNDPTGGSCGLGSTSFGQAQGMVGGPGAALPLPCNQHDICYQTCRSVQGTCDQGMRSAMDQVCQAAYPNLICPYSGFEIWKCIIGCPSFPSGLRTYFTERAQCFGFSATYKFGLDQFGSSAWKERQTQYCDCC